MSNFLASIEELGISPYIRESSYGFPFIITAHAFGYCFIMAANAIVSGRILGFAKPIPIKPLRRLFPVMWIGLIVTVITGTLLVMAAAQKRVPNPILWVKMIMIVVATPMMWKFQMNVFNDPSINDSNMPASARRMAALQIALWLLIMIGGRLIPYSGTIIGEGY